MLIISFSKVKIFCKKEGLAAIIRIYFLRIAAFLVLFLLR